MRTLVLVLGSPGLIACWSGGGSTTPPSNRTSSDPSVAVIEAETVVGDPAKSETQLARQQAIEQARAAGILGKTPAQRAEENRTGPLDREAIRRRVRERLTSIMVCYELRLREDPTLQGTTKVTFVIGADGGVTSSAGSGLDADVDACVADVIKSIQFPALARGGTLRVSYPFVFRPMPSQAP